VQQSARDQLWVRWAVPALQSVVMIVPSRPISIGRERTLTAVTRVDGVRQDTIYTTGLVCTTTTPSVTRATMPAAAGSRTVPETGTSRWPSRGAQPACESRRIRPSHRIALRHFGGRPDEYLPVPGLPRGCSTQHRLLTDAVGTNNGS
jgi:hypothetical protein